MLCFLFILLHVEAQVLLYEKYECFVMQMFVYCVHPVTALNFA